jgi:hypothetical protein
MGILPQQAVELEVEQSAVSRLKDVGPPTEMDGGSIAETEGYHMAGLTEECRPSSTWAERPQ